MRSCDAVERYAVVDAAAGGLAHAVGAYDGDAGTRGRVEHRSGGRAAAEQHRVQARPMRRWPRDRPAPWPAAWRPARCNVGPEPSSSMAEGNWLTSKPVETSSSTGCGAGQQAAHQHLDAGDVIRRQGQQPPARPAQPIMGSRRAGGQRGGGEQRALGVRRWCPSVVATSATSSSMGASTRSPSSAERSSRVGNRDQRGGLARPTPAPARPVVGRPRSPRPSAKARRTAIRCPRRRGRLSSGQPLVASRSRTRSTSSGDGNSSVSWVISTPMSTASKSAACFSSRATSLTSSLTQPTRQQGEHRGSSRSAGCRRGSPRAATRLRRSGIGSRFVHFPRRTVDMPNFEMKFRCYAGFAPRMYRPVCAPMASRAM